MRMRPLALWVALAVCLHAGGAAEAADEAGIKKAIKARIDGTHYLKTNLPYLQGRHGFGTFKKSLVTVSPVEGVKIQASADLQAGVFTATGRRLVLRVNDPVVIDEFEWESEDDSLEIEVEGTGRAIDGEGVLKFVNLQTAEDFEKCWVETFSDVSIEQKYDWPEEIKKAVLEREVREGMTREQVMVAVGSPVRISHSKEEGREIETWVIQQGEGARMGFWKFKFGDQQEVEIKFADGKVAAIGATTEQPALKLK